MNGSAEQAPYRLKTMGDLLQLSTPEFLIEDWLLENTIAMMVGDTGSFKSTLAIDIAVCIQNCAAALNQFVDVLPRSCELVAGISLSKAL